MLYKYLPTDKLCDRPIAAGLEPILAPGTYFIHFDIDGEAIIVDDGQFHGLVVPIDPSIIAGAVEIRVRGLPCFVVTLAQPLRVPLEDEDAPDKSPDR